MNNKYCETGRLVVQQESDAVYQLAKRLDHSFAQACQLLLACQGHIIVMGIGKSGHIANRIAGAFLEAGCPAFFVHPAEAKHGDSGMITTRDIVMMLSKSGETEEITAILPVIKNLNVPLISLTGNPHSTLAAQSTVHLEVSIEKEACPLGLAPTTSTTITLIMGQALAATLSQQSALFSITKTLDPQHS